MLFTNKETNKQVRPSSGTDAYISTHADPTSTRARLCVRKPNGNRCERRGGGGALADSSDFGLLWESEVHKNVSFPYLERR